MQGKKGFVSEKGGRNSVNEGFGKDFCSQGSSVKRSGPFSELPDSESCKVAVIIPFTKISSLLTLSDQLKVITLKPGMALSAEFLCKVKTECLKYRPELEEHDCLALGACIKEATTELRGPKKQCHFRPENTAILKTR